MPFTFLSQQAPVLPLKLAAPGAFDGTALVIGSMVPDLVFAVHGTGVYVDAHSIEAQLWFCLPITLALTWIMKRHVAGPLAAHLPECGRFRLRDYGRLQQWRMPRELRGCLVLVASALIGSFSHIAFDSFTHGFGWVARHVDFMQRAVFALPASLSGRQVHVYDLFQIAGTVIGAVITIWCAFIIGDRQLLRHWYPLRTTPEPTTQSRQRLVIWTVGGATAGLTIAAVTLHIGAGQDAIIRVADATLAGLLVGCVQAHRTMSNRGHAANLDT